jgi:hypothetical protein
LKTLIKRFREAKVSPLILFFLVLGSILRLVYLEDMEWKSDERYLYEASQSLKSGGEFPWVGMPSSKGVRNPGVSVWVFLGLGKFGNDPISMVRGVAILNIIAIWAFLLFIIYYVPEKDREVWLWGLVLFSISANPVLYSRKIWQQCVLVPFLWLFFLGVYFRTLKLGAFLCGFIGALLGQIHMSGFIFVPIVIFAMFVLPERNRTRWFALVMGLVMGGLPLVPWLSSLTGNSTGGHELREPLIEILRFKFWWRWLEDSLGFTLRYHLRKLFWTEFVAEPVWFGCRTFGVGLCYLLSIGFLSQGIATFIKSKSYLKQERLKENLWVVGGAYGFALTLLGLRIYPHYLIIVYPFIHVSLSWMLSERKGLRLGLVICQTFITIWFLSYIHRTGGNPETEYGTSYSRQQLE